MTHPAAENLRKIGNYLNAIANEIDKGNYHLINEVLRDALRLLCDEIIKHNKEINPIVNKLLKTSKEKNKCQK